MRPIRDLLFFLLACGGAFESIAVFFFLSITLRLLPHFADASPYAGLFSQWYLHGTYIVWMIGILVAVGWFVAAKKAMRLWLLFAPVYLPLAYMSLVLIYFNFLPAD